MTQADEQGLATVGQPGAIAVSIRGVSKSFGDHVVLEPTDLEIAQGEFFSLLGPSGCGKTTLLRILGGFETPDSGDVRISGRSVVNDPPYRRRTNMIFQHLALFPHLTVAENIAFGLEMKKVDPAIIRVKVREALDLVRLGDFGKRRIDGLSGGQKQRIAMARALVNEPDVLLLDEPLGALDLQLRLQMQDELRRLHRATGKTFIFVTHDQGEAITMSDRIAVMGNGRIRQIGTPRDVYERPTSRFSAEFMGQSNFFEGKVAGIGPDRIGRIEAAGVLLPCRVPDGLQVGDAAVFVLRYEKASVSAAAGATHDLTGQLVSQTYMGSSARFTVDLEHGPRLIADMPIGGPADALVAGARVSVRWALDAPVVLTD